jgi:hypothetical protein
VSTLAFSTVLTFAGTALADEGRELEELEVTLEVFEDTEALDAFELRLEEVAEREADEEASEFPDHDEMAERMERFEEEVAAAADSELMGVERDARPSEGEDAFEAEIERDHQERLEMADADSADQLDEFDLAEEEEPEEVEEPAGEDLAEDMLEDELSDEELAEEEVAEEEVVDEEIVEEEPVEEELAQEEIIEETDVPPEEEAPTEPGEDTVS